MCNDKQDIGMQLRIIHNLIKKNLDSKASKLLPAGTGTTIKYLLYINGKSCEGVCVHQYDLEREFEVSRAAVSKALSLLEAKGMIERGSVNNDARLKCLTLTQEAKDLLQPLETNLRNTENKLLKGFDVAEIKTLESYLERLIKNMMEEDDA